MYWWGMWRMRYTKKELEIAEKEGYWPPPAYKCRECGDVIQSSYPGEFVSCKCGESYVDQTPHYMRAGGKATIVRNKN